MRILFAILISLPFSINILNAQVGADLKKAENSIDRGNLKDAISYYEKALAAEPANRAANLGLGLVYSELLDNYAKALPYLEKAEKEAVRDSSYDLIFALAKCYHYNGNYDKALTYYDRLKDVQDFEKENDFQKDINKRKEDCLYARAKLNAPADENVYLVNAGPTINSEMPEYVPVLSGHNELLFTSKRKDDKKEELNYLDGKYFESMYIAKIGSNRFTDVRRYTLPDKLMNSQFYKHHQAVVSLSQDGKKLFTFRDSKLYEINLEERTQQSPGEVKIKKFDHYQNHAYLTKDGNTLYFTSDVEGGYGGTDIYKSVKNGSGEWGKPENLGNTVNTTFNEDAPFIANDGTLYFASEGHEGFGNYDIYKSYFVDSKWTTPENLGQPINSSGHDIFLVLDTASANAYFSSGRNGGYGDMDIYKIVYLDKFDKSCPANTLPVLNLSVKDADTSDYKNTVVLNLPSNFRIIQAEWKIKNNSIRNDSNAISYNYGSTGTFPVSIKSLLWCDTCLTPVVACLNIENKIEKFAPHMPLAVDNIEKKIEEKIDKAADKAMATSSSNVSSKEKETKTSTSKDKDALAVNNSKKPDEKSVVKKSEDHNKTANTADFDFTNLLFDFNSATLRADAKNILDKNIKMLRENEKIKIEINGYADARGNSSANQMISNERAVSVKNYLLKNGIKRSQISATNGRGATKLVNGCTEQADCSDKEHEQNRRVEIVLVNK